MHSDLDKDALLVLATERHCLPMAARALGMPLREAVARLRRLKVNTKHYANAVNRRAAEIENEISTELETEQVKP